MVKMNRGEPQVKFLSDTVGVTGGPIVCTPDGCVTADGLGPYAPVAGMGSPAAEGAMNPRTVGAASGKPKQVPVTGGE